MLAPNMVPSAWLGKRKQLVSSSPTHSQTRRVLLWPLHLQKNLPKYSDPNLQNDEILYVAIAFPIFLNTHHGSKSLSFPSMPLLEWLKMLLVFLPWIVKL